MVLAYDLLEDGRMIEVNVTKFFPPCFKKGGKIFYVTRQKIRYKKVLPRH